MNEHYWKKIIIGISEHFNSEIISSFYWDILLFASGYVYKDIHNISKVTLIQLLLITLIILY